MSLAHLTTAPTPATKPRPKTKAEKAAVVHQPPGTPPNDPTKTCVCGRTFKARGPFLKHVDTAHPKLDGIAAGLVAYVRGRS